MVTYRDEESGGVCGQVTIEKRSAIATLVIQNEARRNALSQSMWEQLFNAVRALDEDSEVKVVVVRGSGNKAFSAGADISEFAELAADPEKLAANNDSVQRAQAALEALKKPTIALIFGACVGGGCGLALACDFRFASPQSTFAITPAKLGLLYSVNDTRRLYNLVGPAMTREILYTGRMLSAIEAEQMGMLNKLHADDELEQQVYRFADELAAGSQYALRGIKTVLAKLEGHGQATDEEIQALFDRAFTSEDCLEGTAAFLQKRPPKFTYK